MQKLVDLLCGSPMTGIVLSIVAFQIATWISYKLRTPLANPLLLAIIITASVISFTPLTLEQYNKGGDVIALFLPMATAALAMSIYNQLETLKKNLLPVLAGCASGALTSLVSVYTLSRLLKLDEVLTASILPKSVTTPIALELAQMGGGLPAIAVAGVLVTGVTGVITAPILIRVLKIKDPVAQGVAIGTCSHALGTSKAIELGETQAAMGGIAIGITGMCTVLFMLFFFL